MSDLTKVDTDFQQFNDADTFHNRRSTDNDPVQCTPENCAAIYVMNARIDRHRDEINALTKDLTKNTADTSKILGIVTKGENFFNVVDWIGTKVMALVALFGAVIGIIYTFKDHGK